MTTHNSVAKSVRLRKEKEPDKYCSNPRCLYRTDEAFCPKHSMYKPGEKFVGYVDHMSRWWATVSQ